jgi:hypothetical protein
MGESTRMAATALAARGADSKDSRHYAFNLASYKYTDKSGRERRPERERAACVVRSGFRAYCESSVVGAAVTTEPQQQTRNASVVVVTLSHL